MGEGVTGPYPSAKFNPFGFKMWAYSPQNRQNCQFLAKICSKWYDFYQILRGGGSPRYALSRQILPFWLRKCGLTAQKSAENANFWYKFSPKGYIPLGDFYKILPGEGAPGPHLHAKFDRCSFKNERERNYQTCRLLLMTDVIHYLVTSVAYRRTHLLRRHCNCQ